MRLPSGRSAAERLELVGEVMRRFGIVATAWALVLSLASVAPALASAGNDTAATATAVAIPSTTNENTAVADAADATETALNVNCGAPAVGHGVWFTITPSADMFVAIDTSASDYSAGIMLFAGAPADATFLDCGPATIIDGLTGGQTYYALAFGDGLSAETGGNLVFEVREAIAPPDISLQINRSGTVDKFGTVHLWGTATCTSSNGSGNVFEIFGDVTQRVGRILIRGFFDSGVFISCDGTAQRWDVFFTGDNGIFAGGKAATVAIAIGCTDLCSDSFTQAVVQLKRSGK
jgi:hypothetical protein